MAQKANVFNHKSFIDAFPHPILLFDQDARLESYNELGALIVQNNTEENLTQLVQLTKKVIETKQPYQISILNNDEHGIQHYIATAFLNNDGRVFITLYDQSKEASFRQVLIESRQRYKDLVEISSDFIWETNSEGKFIFISPQGALGWHPHDLIGREADHFLKIEDRLHSPFHTDTAVMKREVQFKRHDHEFASLLISSVPLTNDDGDFSGSRGICQDITLFKRQEKQLNIAKTQEQVINQLLKVSQTVDIKQSLKKSLSLICKNFSCSSGLIFRREEDGELSILTTKGKINKKENQKIKDFVFKFKSSFFKSDAMILSKIPFQKKKQGILVLLRPSSSNWNEGEKKLLKNISSQLGIILAQINYQDELERLSSTDPLTQLLNRRAFCDETDKRIKHAKRTKLSSSMLYIDIDNFKALNDTYGHKAGDEFLKDFSGYILQTSRVGDLCGRLGGDEFVLWLEGTDIEGAKIKSELLKNMVIGLSKKYPQPVGKALDISIGHSVYNPDEPKNIIEFLEETDQLMYKIKKKKK